MRGRKALIVGLAVNVVGGGVFVGLLVASGQWPALATPLQALAFLWGAAVVVGKFGVWCAIDRSRAELRPAHRQARGERR
jgi:hypothetical protein